MRSGAQDHYHILQYLLGRSDLSDRDITTIILSLFTDGLSTVCRFLSNAALGFYIDIYYLPSPTHIFDFVSWDEFQTVPTLMCCLYCLAAHTKVQEEAYEEARQSVDNGRVTSSTLNGIPFLKAFVKEVFRMYPNGIETDRILQSDHEIGGFCIPAGVSTCLGILYSFICN